MSIIADQKVWDWFKYSWGFCHINFAKNFHVFEREFEPELLRITYPSQSVNAILDGSFNPKDQVIELPYNDVKDFFQTQESTNQHIKLFWRICRNMYFARWGSKQWIALAQKTWNEGRPTITSNLKTRGIIDSEEEIDLFFDNEEHYLRYNHAFREIFYSVIDHIHRAERDNYTDEDHNDDAEESDDDDDDDDEEDDDEEDDDEEDSDNEDGEKDDHDHIAHWVLIKQTSPYKRSLTTKIKDLNIIPKQRALDIMKVEAEARYNKLQFLQKAKDKYFTDYGNQIEFGSDEWGADYTRYYCTYEIKVLK
jgi:hypothetical protein